MKISRFSVDAASSAHEGTILAADVLPEGVEAPFQHAWGYLDQPGQMEVHSHPKEEVYFFFGGEGYVMVGGERQAVRPGDVVYIPPDLPHTVINERQVPLLWAALWWETAPQVP